MSFGTKLKMYRKRARMTQEQLAEQVGLQRSSVGHMEGDLWSPNTRTLARIRNVLNLSPDELIDLLEELDQRVEVSM